MDTQKQIIGRMGEELAKNYLINKGYKIIDRNYREKWGEIDIIAQKNKTTFFIEVKTMRIFDSSELFPEDQMSKNKISKFKKISQSYANHNKIENWQMDAIAIELDEKNNLKTIRYWENVF